MSYKTIAQLIALLPMLTCLYCCEPITHLAGNQTYNPPGNKYFNNRTAKWLGSDSTAGDTCWLVDAASFDSLHTLYHGITGKEAQCALDRLDRVRIHINDSVALLLQKTRDSTALTGREYQMLIYLDLFSGNLSAVWAPVGDNHKDTFDIKRSQSGYFYLPEADYMIPLHRMLLAQAHGHPKPMEQDLELLRDQSDSDRCTAFRMQGAVYPVIAVDPHQGVQGELCRVLPRDIDKPASPDILVGMTQGEPAQSAVFNVGFDALLIYSKGMTTQTGCLVENLTQISHGSLATTSSPLRSR